MKMKNQMLVVFATHFSLLALGELGGQADEFSRNQDGVRPVVGGEVDVGLIVDLGSRDGKMIHSRVSMAISDFYSLHDMDYQFRIVLHTRDSRGDPSHALSAAFDLLENDKIGIILSAQTSTLEAKLLADFEDHTKIPVICISAPFGSSPSISNYAHFIQNSQQESAQMKGIVAFIKLHKWENVILIHEDNENWSYFLEDTKFQISYKSAMATSFKDDQIIDELHKLKAIGTSVFIVHVSQVLAYRLFVHAKRLGMISQGYVWIVTSKTINHLQNLRDSSIFESMQGVVGFRSYIRESKELHDFTSRMRKQVYDKEPDMLEMMNYFIAQIVNVMNFEIVNVLGEGERRVGFWTSAGKITKKLHAPASHGKHLSSGSTIDELETILWPGGTSTVPKGRMMQMNSKVLRIGVPASSGFKQLLKVDRDLQTNATIVSGFCIDVFIAAMTGLKHPVQYQFVPFEDNNPIIPERYSNLVYQVYLQKYDAVVGDITITANRSLYVDFTLPYSDLGIGMVTRLTPKDSKNLWIFLAPLTPGLWLTIVGIYVLTALVIWLIERPAVLEQTPPSGGQIGRMFGFSFSILVFAHWERLSSNLSRSVVLLWVFVVFILGSSYTATLTSLMTVNSLEINSQMSNIGSQAAHVTQAFVDNVNLKNSGSTFIWLSSPEDFATALSKGSKNGGVSAIVDEMPYIKIFLEKYPAQYSFTSHSDMPIANGFGFAFPKGSAMAPDISREIAKLRQDGRLLKLENSWFKSPKTGFDSENTSRSVNALTVGDFRGLFYISGTFSTLAFLLFFASFLYKNFHIIKRWGQPEFLKQYVCMIIFRNRRDANVVYPEVNNI